MSVFSKQTWGGYCVSANQSPINLSQSSAKPCNLSCSFSFDDTTSAGGMVMISDEGLVLSGDPQLSSCKFRDQTYFCDAIVVNHPSHHTLEGVQADGEVIALCRTPSGDRLMVSSLFHVNPNDTSSSSFFKQFVSYASQSGFTKVSLNSWSLNQMGSGGYYVYSGSTVIPPCTPCEWVVFKTMINMDPTDFAFLVRNVQAGSRNIQSLGNRDIFYNDQEAGGALPHDNKTYLVMRPLKGNKKPKPVKAVDLKTDESKQHVLEADKKNSTTEKVKKHISDHPWEYFSLFLTILATVAGIYFGYNNYVTTDGHAAFSLLEWSRDLAKRWRLPKSSP